METFLLQCSSYFFNIKILELCYYFLAMEERAIQRAERRRFLAEKKKKQEEEKLVIDSKCKLSQKRRICPGLS